MKRQNRIIQMLEDHPCTYAEVPGKLSPARLDLKNGSRIRQIRVAGNRSKKPGRGWFKSVYYLKDDEDRAIQKFIDVNSGVISQLDFSRYNALDSGLSREMSQKIRAAIL